MNTTATIPDELVEEILGWLLTSELLTSVSKVSTRLHKLLAKGRDQFWQRKFKEIVDQQRNRYDDDDDDGSGSGSGSGDYEPPVGLNPHQLQRCCWLLEHEIQAHHHDLNAIKDHESLMVDGGDSTNSSEDGNNHSSPPSFLHHGALLFHQSEACRLLRSDRENDDDDDGFLKRFLNLASSTHHNDHESIENVLNDNYDDDYLMREDWNRIRNDDRVSDVTARETRRVSRNITVSIRQSWWSSIPRNDPEMPETLAFCTRYPLTLVTEVAIKPYADWRSRTYSWKKMIVRVYNLPPLAVVSTETDIDGEQEPSLSTYKSLCPSTISDTASVVSASSSPTASTVPDETTTKALQYLESQTPVYESPLLDTPPPHNNAWQYHKLPCGVVGNVITFALVGKNFEEFEASGYYACVQRVAARGIPLHESKEIANPDLSKIVSSFSADGRTISREMEMHRTSQVVPLLVRR